MEMEDLYNLSQLFLGHNETRPIMSLPSTTSAFEIEDYHPLLKVKPDGYINYDEFRLHYSSPFDLPYKFEEIDWKYWVTWFHTKWYYPIYATIVYVIVIFGLQEVMKKRKAFDLRRELFVWNSALGIFSIIGFLRFSPPFVQNLLEPNGLHNSICVWQRGNMPIAFWSLVFVTSKYIELGDTLFIVLRKRPLQFIQWYHHIITLAVSWITTPYIEPISRYYITMNFGVHSLMYPYFALRALDVKVPRQVANVITTLQLAQMLVGLGVNSYSGILYYFGGGEACFRHPNSVKMFSLVYGSFVLLFGELFYKLVMKSCKKSKQA